MKILRQRSEIATDRGERAQETSQVSSDGVGADYRSRQVGLDRIDVSRAGETAAALVDHTLRERQERVAELASRFQAGNYRPNFENLSRAILDEETDVDLAYAE